jgi:hypothetical protein
MKSCGTAMAEGYWILKEKADIWISRGDARSVANIHGFIK